ncbi:MAG: aminotransferase class I/II-fold pyridoxal phosphate-dependent enzyme [Candidatus Omnitrophica bacterium]|nr:aminotransferase class I/II-fold pyridoxal phosphate-dependent enzyme [Candidatus Omnitrophota bacterium]
MIEYSLRLKNLPSYLFVEIDRLKQKLKKEKEEFIDLSIGDPDIPAPQAMIDVLYESAKIKENQKYALDKGKLSLRRAIRKWMKSRFGVNLDEEKEILPLLGSKEGLAHFPLAFVNKDDYVIVPSPGYPGYKGAAVTCEAKVFELPLREENNFLPDLEEIPKNIRNKAKIIYLNYPNNPTTVLASREFLKKLVKFCSKYRIIIAYDNAYSEIYFKKKPISLLEIKGAQELVLEFHSFSKTFCMTGFRIGWCCGNKDLVAGLLKIKTNIDSGIFSAIQDAATYVLEKEKRYVIDLRKIIKKRKEVFCEGLKELGFSKFWAESTFYVWIKLPKKFKSSIDFCKYLLKKRIVATPGIGFGKFGEGFIRFALTVKENILRKAIFILKG